MPRYNFPDPLSTDPGAEGLICFGGDLELDTLLDAYRQGLFPWFNEGEPIAWWCPEPRCIIQPQHFVPSKSLLRNMKKYNYRVRIDSAFEQVIQACAAPRAYSHDTWISPVMQESYTRLHRLGDAHSVEIWCDQELIGGLYGISIGKVFFGESMFSRRTDSSKMAFYVLMLLLQAQHCPFVDCQLVNDHLLSLGAEPINRNYFLKQLKKQTQQPAIAWHAYQNRVFWTKEIATQQMIC